MHETRVFSRDSSAFERRVIDETPGRVAFPNRSTTVIPRAPIALERANSHLDRHLHPGLIVHAQFYPSERAFTQRSPEGVRAHARDVGLARH